jgi:hypothetical protein
VENIRVVLFDPADGKTIPAKLDRYHRFHADHDFDAIVRWLGHNAPKAIVTSTSSSNQDRDGSKSAPSRRKRRGREQAKIDGLWSGIGHYKDVGTEHFVVQLSTVRLDSDWIGEVRVHGQWSRVPSQEPRQAATYRQCGVTAHPPPFGLQKPPP